MKALDEYAESQDRLGGSLTALGKVLNEHVKSNTKLGKLLIRLGRKVPTVDKGEAK